MGSGLYNNPTFARDAGPSEPSHPRHCSPGVRSLGDRRPQASRARVVNNEPAGRGPRDRKGRQGLCTRATCPRARVRGHHGRHGSRERPLTGHGPGVGRAVPAKAASSRESPSTGKRHAVGKVPQLAVGKVPQLANGMGVGHAVQAKAASSRESPSTGERHGSRESPSTGSRESPSTG